MDKNNMKVQEWEELKWKYQQPNKTATPAEKRMLLNKIFDLNEYTT